jgi:saccharopine dehydrogenase-like NADP-dependent oxidoreductase
MRISVLGAGRIGRAIVRDLASDGEFELRVADLSEQALSRLKAEVAVEVISADLTKVDTVAKVVAGCDLTICAVPGFMGFETLKRVLQAGKHVVDISFFGEDPFRLDDLARDKGVTAVVDCGVAPGLSNIVCGHVAAELDRVDSYVCYVGGLPVERRWPYEYKAVFSPVDVLEEYTRPVYQVEGGREVLRPALSEVELIDFPGLGTLEAFNTDGLRTLRRTMDIPFMKEKTLRYPGHANLMRILRDTGFFGAAPVALTGQSVRPLDLTSKLLFDHWSLREGEEDLTVMKVVTEGSKSGRRYRYTHDLLDRYDREANITAMARTTGYTCTIVARMLARGLLHHEGICPPELVGRDERCYEFLLAEYARHKIKLSERVTPIEL